MEVWLGREGQRCVISWKLQQLGLLERKSRREYFEQSGANVEVEIKIKMGVIGNRRRGFKTEGPRTIHSPQRGKTVAGTCFLRESFFSSQEDIEEESVLVRIETLTEPFICAGVGVLLDGEETLSG